MYDEIIEELCITVPADNIQKFLTKKDGLYIQTKKGEDILLFLLEESLTHEEFISICAKLAVKISYKGKHGGYCNITSCQKPAAMYFNKSTKAYYCKRCAEGINWPGGRADCMRLYGVPLLCEYVPLEHDTVTAAMALENLPVVYEATQKTT